MEMELFGCQMTNSPLGQRSHILRVPEINTKPKLVLGLESVYDVKEIKMLFIYFLTDIMCKFYILELSVYF